MTAQLNSSNKEGQINKFKSEQEEWLAKEKKLVDLEFQKNMAKAQEDIQGQYKEQVNKIKSEVTATIQKELDATLTNKKEQINVSTKKEYQEYCLAVDSQMNEKIKLMASQTEEKLQKYSDTQKQLIQEEMASIQSNLKQFQDTEEQRIAKGI